MLVTALQQLAELLHTEEDLSKVSALKKKFAKEKASTDVKLDATLGDEIDTVMRNIKNLNTSSVEIGAIKTNLQTLGTIYEDFKRSITRYDLVREFSELHTYIQEAGDLYTNMSGFHGYVQEIDALLEEELSQGVHIDSPVLGLLRIHYKLNAGCNFRERLWEYAKPTSSDFRSIVERIVAPLEEVERKFKLMLRDVVAGVIESLKDGNVVLVTKLFRIIDYEQREDLKLELVDKLRHLQYAMDVEPGTRQGLADRRVQPRHYYAFFTLAIADSIAETFQNCEDAFEYKVDVLDNLEWIFNDLLMAKNELPMFAPPRWRLFETYYTLYHAQMKGFITRLVALDPSTEEILRILSFDKLYTDVALNELKLAKGDIKSLFEDKDDFLDNYLSLMTSKVSEWMTNLEVREQEEFKARTHQPETLEDNYTLQAITTIFQIFNQQINIAADSGYGKIVNGVIQSFCVILTKRTANWNALLTLEVERMLNSVKNNIRPGGVAETVNPGLLEYIIALANDQLKSVNYCETIMDSYSGMLSQKYQDEVATSLNAVMDGLVDLGNNCIHSLTVIMFNDLVPNFDLVLQGPWYKKRSPDEIVLPIAETLMDYLTDFAANLNPVLLDLLVDTTVDHTILYYFRSMRQQTQFKPDKLFHLVMQDVELLFPVFAPFYDTGDEHRTLDALKRKFRVFELFMDLVSVERNHVGDKWREVLTEFNDFPLLFVERVFACRKDMDSPTVSRIMEELRAQSEGFKYQSHAVPLTATFMRKFSLEGAIL